jgi:2,3-bisphosphoglycerate-independent phosphoglycerate mutase
MAQTKKPNTHTHTKPSQETKDKAKNRNLKKITDAVLHILNEKDYNTKRIRKKFMPSTIIHALF